MSGFIGRVVSWFADKFLVEALSRSTRFQSIALKIDTFLNKNKKVINDVTKDQMEVLKKKADTVKEQVQQVNIKEIKTFDISSAYARFKDDVTKEVAKQQQQQQIK